MSKVGKKDGFYNRQDQEDREGMPSVKSDAPSERLQPEAQVATTMDATDTKTEKVPGIKIEKDEIPSQVVHTKKVADVISGAHESRFGGGAGGGVGLRSGSYSGNTGIVGDMSATTYLNKPDRSETRTGKKLDSTLKKVNYLYNEQVTVEYDESKPLAENPSATQGYNGTYRNEHARTQKKSGFVPAELYYDRSVDEIHQDFIYPVMGQTINDPAADTIPSFAGVGASGADAQGYVDFSCPRGNVLPGALEVSFSASGAITGFNFITEDITPDDQDNDVANISALNGIIDANIAELDRQIMDAKAGDELSPKFSPLPRSIKAPTDTLALMRDIEASTGSEIFMAYKKTAAAMSYQLNKAAKDGQRLETPIEEMLVGCMYGDNADKTVIGSYTTHSNPFTAANFKNGSPALMIHIFDSPNKYSTKGDFLLQPRGFRMHLQTADNNMNPLRVNKKFVDVVNNNEVFSTIDKEYDPFLPVFISDKAALAHPFSLNSFIESNAPKAFSYTYNNNSNNRYVVNVYHPLVKGLYDFFTTYGPKIVSDKGINGAGTITIPCKHSTTGFSLWSLILLAATPFIVKNRIPSFIDVIDYEENFGYPFRQLISLKDANPMAAKNYSNPDYNEPLKVGVMNTAAAFKWVFPETYWMQSEILDDALIVMPWYHNELGYAINSSNKLVLSETPCVMSMPSVRSGSRLGVLDTIYSMSERDVRLCLDRQTVYPGYKENKNTTLDVYKYGQTGDGQIVVRLDNDVFTIRNILKTPREIGWVIPAPNGVLSPIVTAFSSDSSFTTKLLGFDSDDFEKYFPGNFRIRYWRGMATDDTDGILSADAININRAMSLQQVFKTIVNQRMINDNYNGYVNSDFIVSLAACFDATASNPIVTDNKSCFKPFVLGGNVASDSRYKTITLQKYYWTRIQRLPFAINPFDCAPTKKDALNDDAVKTDPYDFLYIFGCAGWRGSDYNEDSYNREKERLNLGMLFIEDPYFNDSLAYRS